ncbi:hypothetical protein EBT31_12855 [bacterium]|nr:hypothetical protein [bacterium]
MTITLTREEAQQVLDALETIKQGCVDARENDPHIHKDAKDLASLVIIDCNRGIETVRARLSTPEPERYRRTTMTDKQPEALRLADDLDEIGLNEAAFELRRLHVVNFEKTITT